MSKSEQWTLLRAGVDPDQPGFYPLHYAIDSVSPALVLEFLRFGADPNRRTPQNGHTPLHLLREDLGLALLEPLIAAGADINIRDAFGSTALMHTVHDSDFRMAKAILAHGADPNPIDVQGDTALTFAVRRGSAEMVRALVEARAKTDGPELEARLATLSKEQRAKLKSILADKPPLHLGKPPEEQRENGEKENRGRPDT